MGSQLQVMDQTSSKLCSTGRWSQVQGALDISITSHRLQYLCKERAAVSFAATGVFLLAIISISNAYIYTSGFNEQLCASTNFCNFTLIR